MIALLLAMARPQAGTSYNMEVTEGIAIQLLVDISSSMDMRIQDQDGQRISLAWN